MPDQWIGLYDGVPPDVAFSSTGGKGTPVVIDTNTDTPYYVKPGTGPTALAGGSSGGQAAIQFKDECSNLGSLGGVTSVDFTGAGVSATVIGPALTVSIAGSSGGLTQPQILARGLGA